MARYIDADALIEAMDKRYKEKKDIVPNNLAEGFVQMERLIREQPTAFNMDAVAADIEDFREEAEQFGFASALSDIVEVVRNGGVE